MPVSCIDGRAARFLSPACAGERNVQGRTGRGVTRAALSPRVRGRRTAAPWRWRRSPGRVGGRADAFLTGGRVVRGFDAPVRWGDRPSGGG